MTSPSLSHSIFTTNLDESILIQSNYIGWCIVISYISFVTVIGPRIMKNQKPFELRMLMIIYNAVLFVLNAYLAFNSTIIAIDLWPCRCDIHCFFEKACKDYHRSLFLMYSTKLVELLDTVVFILRKKFRQASFLHIYHHSAVFTVIWICIKYKMAGYYGILMGVVNFSIHMLLYTYYTVCALNPGSGKYLWWKKYITTIQITQFFLYLIFIAYNVMTGCEKLDLADYFNIVAMIFMTVLLLHFYYETYKVKKQ